MFMAKENEKDSKQLKEMIELSTAIRNLLILNLSKTDVPHEKIARAAHIQTKKLYEIIPKQKKPTKNKNKEKK